MRKHILLLAIPILLLFSSCGLFKKVFIQKDSSYNKQTTEKSTVKDSTVKKTDKTVIVETEKANETKYTPETKIESEKKAGLTDLINGLTVLDTGLVTIQQSYDTLSKTLKTKVTLKPQAVNFQVDKTKTTYTDKTEETKTNTEEKNKTAIIAEEKHFKKEKEPAKMGIWLIIMLVIALIVGGLIYLWFKRKKKLLT